MKMLKAKFAVSKKEADKITGGFISIDPIGGGNPWDPNGGITGGNGNTDRYVYCCGSSCDATCRTSKATADRICGGNSTGRMCSY